MATGNRRIDLEDNPIRVDRLEDLFNLIFIGESVKMILYRDHDHFITSEAYYDEEEIRARVKRRVTIGALSSPVLDMGLIEAVMCLLYDSDEYNVLITYDILDDDGFHIKAHHTLLWTALHLEAYRDSVAYLKKQARAEAST